MATNIACVLNVSQVDRLTEMREEHGGLVAKGKTLLLVMKPGSDIPFGSAAGQLAGLQDDN